MIKKSLYLIVLFVSSLWITLAADTYNECSEITTDKTWTYLKLQNFSHFESLSQDDLIRAFDNLKKFCCKAKISATLDCSNVSTDWYYPSSAILFDQIFDIYMRKLDAKQENDNWDDLTYGIEPDASWKEWREFITNIWNDSNGLVPWKIKDEYNKYWESDPDNIMPNFNIADIDNWKLQLSSKLENFSWWTLIDKYQNACDVTMWLYIDIMWIWSNDRQDNANIKQSDIYKNCSKVVSDRIQSEKYYVEILMKWKALTLLTDNLNTYMATYFLETKLTELQNSFFNSQTMFSEIVKWVSRLIKNCS